MAEVLRGSPVLKSNNFQLKRSADAKKNDYNNKNLNEKKLELQRQNHITEGYYFPTV